MQTAGACTLYLAAYDLDERMVGVRSVSIDGAANSRIIPVPMPENLPSYYDVSAFLLDSGTNAPLCEAVRVENAGNAGYK